MTADRKRDAREKFLLGGIVAKAGLTKVNRAFLLGGLLELAKLAPGSPEYRRLHDLGEKAFRAEARNADVHDAGETAAWR